VDQEFSGISRDLVQFPIVIGGLAVVVNLDGMQSGQLRVTGGAILAILGSVERAELLINRVDAERKSVNRAGVLAKINAAAAERQGRTGRFGADEPSVVPAE
jgi:hypothetical protein